jgi:hypothetical protein
VKRDRKVNTNYFSKKEETYRYVSILSRLGRYWFIPDTGILYNLKVHTPLDTYGIWVTIIDGSYEKC